METYNIKCKTDIHVSKAQKFISSAVDFLCSNANVDKSRFELLCIVSRNFLYHINTYYGKTQKENTSYATFIPSFLQKNIDEKDIVIINWEKIAKEPYDERFIISIFIHEFSHYLDYCLCSKLEEKYNVHFDLNVEQRSPDNLIYQTFSNWSEIRAKYYQMKYYNNVEEICNQINANCANINDFASRLKSIHSFGLKNKQEEKEQLENKINYSCLHLSGLILAYEEINSDNILNEIQELKDKLKQNDDINNLLDAAFNINMLFKVFDKILEKSL